MQVDIKTIVIILGFTHLMQVLVFYHQYRVNKAYNGVGWWLLWSTAEVIGFSALLLRGIPYLLPEVIILQNSMIIAGTVFLYIGVKQFFDKKSNLAILIPVLSVFFTGFVYFLFIKNDIQIRSAFISAILAFMSILTASSLFRDKTRSINATANFNASIFLVHGVIFLYRTVMIIKGTQVDNVFASDIFNLLPYFDALIVSLLWTFGLIIMLNQRLNAEMLDTKDELLLIFNTSPDAAMISRLEDGLIIDTNDGFTSVTGYTHAELSGKSVLEVNIWKDNVDIQKIRTLLKNQGYCENYESSFILKDGSEIIGLLSAKIINLHGVPHIISITRNITDRKNLEKDLQENELKFRLLFENMTEGVALHEMIYNNKGIPVNYRIIDVNNAFENHTNISSEKACGALATELYEDEQPPYISKYNEVVVSGKSIFFEAYFQPMDKYFGISVIATRPGCFATIFMDISERKKSEADLRTFLEESEHSRTTLLSILEDQILTEESLRESEEKFRAMVETIPVAIHLTVGKEQVSKYLNPMFIKLFGYTIEDIPSVKQWWPLAYPDEAYQSKISVEWNNKVSNAIETHLPIEPMETIVTCKDGSKKYILWDFITLGDTNYSCGLDLTDRKRAEKALLVLNSELEQRISDRTAQLETVNKELEAFSYSVSHDLRAPLRHINGFADLLKRDSLEILPEKSIINIDKIIGSAKRMGTLIDDLLSFSRTGRAELKKSSFNMRQTLDEAITTFKISMENRIMDLHISDLPLINGDYNLLRQVWINLLDNALKYTGPRKKAVIEIGFKEVSEEFIFFIKDNGVGFDMEYSSKLFGVFQRLHSMNEFEGTGIGLANVRRIISRHAGKTWAEAELDKGAIFYFSIPK